MRERASLIGGTLSIGPGADGGVRIELRIPLTAAKGDPA